MATNYSGILTKGYQSSLQNTEIEDGKIRITVDTAQLFLDTEEGRKEITDFIKGYTEEQIRSIIAPLPKFYLSSDTNKLLINDGEDWVIVAEANVDHVSSADNATNASTADYAKTAGSATSASTATYATNAGTATLATNATNASTADYAKTAGSANSATSATNASTATYATSAGTATNASTANYAKTAGSADSATNASTATYATNAGTATSATNATNASTADYASNAESATNDGNGNPISTTYAPLASPIFTGTPTVPTAAVGTTNEQIANTSFVNSAINSAVAGITSFDTSVVTSISDLPTTGVKGTIYFVPSTNTEEKDIYDEYIWVSEKYERIGSAKLDLTGYVDAVSISGTGNAITGVTKSGSTITYNKDTTFLTEHPSVTTSSSTATEAPNAGATMQVIDNVVVDDFGHITSYRKKTVTLPNTVSNASTAVYAKTAASATNASTATYANSAGTATSATNASTATYATGAGALVNVDLDFGDLDA